MDHATPRRVNSDESESTNGQSGQAAVVTYPVPYSSKYVAHILAPRSLTYKQKYAPIAVRAILVFRIEDETKMRPSES